MIGPLSIDLSNSESLVFYRQISNEKKPGELEIEKQVSHANPHDNYDLTKVEIRLWRNGKDELHTLDFSGKLTISNLIEGYYFIEETKVPDNLILNQNRLLIKITANTTTVLTLTNESINIDEKPLITTEEKRKTLVNTGYNAYTLSGGLLLLGGISLLLLRKHTKQK